MIDDFEYFLEWFVVDGEMRSESIGLSRLIVLQLVKSDGFERDLFFFQEFGDARYVPVTDAGDDLLIFL